MTIHLFCIVERDVIATSHACACDCARLQQSLVEKVTKEAKDREEQALSAASAAAGGSKR